VRILVADADDHARGRLVDALNEAGHEAAGAADGAEALKRVAADHPDLVVAEILLPKLDGFALCRELRRHPHMRAIPLVFHTDATSGPEDEAFALALGANGFLAKPADAATVIAKAKEPARPDAKHSERSTELSEIEYLREHDRRLAAMLGNRMRALEQTNAALAAREAYLRAVIENEPECVKLIGPDGALLQMNAAGLRMIEADSLAQVQDRNICALVAEDHRTAFRELMERVLRGESGTLEFRVVGLKGGKRWLETHASPLRDAAGEVVALLGITRDITESKRTRQALQDAEARLRLALEAGRVGIWDWDMVTGRIVWSRWHEAFWGMAPGTFGGTYAEFAARLHPEDREELERAIAQAVTQRSAYRHEFRVVWPDSTVHWISGQGEPHFDETGKAVRMVGTVADVTERKLAEQAVRESSSFNEQIIRGAQEGIIVIDRDLRYAVWNPFMERLTGRRAEEVIGKRPLEVFPELRGTRLDAALRRAMTGEAVKTDDVLLTSAATGGRHWVTVEHAPLHSMQDEIIGVIVTMHEITERKQAEEAVYESQRTLTSVLANLPGLVYRCRNEPSRRADFVSEGCLALTGYPASDLVGNAVRSYADLIHPDDRAQAWNDIQAAVAARRRFQLTYRIRTASGEEKWVWEQGHGVYSENGESLFLEGFASDITGRVEAEHRIKRLNRVYAMLSGVNALIVRVQNREELFQEVCRLAVDAGEFSMVWIGVVDKDAGRLRAAAWSGAERGFLQLISHRLTLGAGTDASLAVRTLEGNQAIIVNDVEHDPRAVFKDAYADRDIRAIAGLPLLVGGEPVGVMMLHAPERGFFDEAEIRLLLDLAGDISFALDHIQKEERINYLAYYDPLTGLANRTLFHERLTQFLRTAERERQMLALGILDLDHLQTINDALGRRAGDAVLVEMGRRMARCVEDGAQVAHLGADRFGVVFPEIKNEGDVAHILEETFSLSIAQPFVIENQELRISAKMGIALYPNDGSNADTLFRNSEAALKKAKQYGDPFVFYTEKMTDRIAESLELENKLRRALERDEFLLHYQPKVDTETRRVIGVEALIRWMDPGSGMILPQQFISLMEATGIIAEVGAWVIRQAMQDYRYWCAQGLAAPPIAVNVSAAQLRKRDFIETLKSAIDDMPQPVPIEIEITESVLMENIEDSMARIEAVHALGVNIAIDDFGTGYSSLGYLTRLPAQVLKIDVSFVSRMLTDPDVMTLVSTIISLAHSMRLQVVAEGVETQRQAELLRELRCDGLQGYFISPPVSREELVDLLPRAKPPLKTVTGKRRRAPRRQTGSRH
jgi:diguanylate cyclase (GGDEF)-like protein/PAS domain S-box-containing protein